MDDEIEIGTKVPLFTAIDQDGDEFSSEELQGQSYILYFYPKDDTPGCTKEACSFRDHFETLEELGLLVVGVSPDDPKSHKKFSEKYNLPFTLLSDEELEICQAFDAIKEQEVAGEVIKKVMRTTFLVHIDGKIAWMEKPVKVEGHTERILEAMRTKSK